MPCPFARSFRSLRKLLVVPLEVANQIPRLLDDRIGGAEKLLPAPLTEDRVENHRRRGSRPEERGARVLAGLDRSLCGVRRRIFGLCRGVCRCAFRFRASILNPARNCPRRFLGTPSDPLDAPDHGTTRFL